MDNRGRALQTNPPVLAYDMETELQRQGQIDRQLPDLLPNWKRISSSSEHVPASRLITPSPLTSTLTIEGQQGMCRPSVCTLWRRRYPLNFANVVALQRCPEASATRKPCINALQTPLNNLCTRLIPNGPASGGRGHGLELSGH